MRFAIIASTAVFALSGGTVGCDSDDSETGFTDTGDVGVLFGDLGGDSTGQDDVSLPDDTAGAADSGSATDTTAASDTTAPTDTTAATDTLVADTTAPIDTSEPADVSGSTDSDEPSDTLIADTLLEDTVVLDTQMDTVEADTDLPDTSAADTQTADTAITSGPCRVTDINVSGRNCNDPFIIGRNNAQTGFGWSENTTGASNASDLPASLPNVCDDDAGDHFYQIWLNVGQQINVSGSPMEFGYDMMISLYRGETCETAITCVTQGGGGFQESFPYQPVETGWHTIVIDGPTAADVGPYVLIVSLDCPNDDCGCGQ